ncbi:right-handed parallel beta-helix repeat-containing protein [Priestia aryabhattai]|uniref:right-handed parallel beta-helix repeat-containing protein n=1 Tax=Priestia aryabhattai TaxID=412384 RepID=UPI0015F3EAAE|nr:right-handed parallel beta-helix repeat-containing protein [Priestia aryabhattai]
MSDFINKALSKKNKDDIGILQNSLGIGISKYAKGDGTDETAKVQSGLNDASGKIIIFPYGFSFKVSTLTIPDNTIIFGYGSKIYNTTTHQTILSLGNNVKIYGLEIQGAGNSSYNELGRGIGILGNYNSSNSTIDYKSDIYLKDCYIHDFGGHGVHAEYAKNIKIDNCKIENVGYSGVMGLSVLNMHVINRTHIKGISPGNTYSYGVIFSRRADTNSLTQYPRSKDCSVVGCTVEDNPNWEGLDTHAGENILFANNIVRNCKIGIVAVPSQLATVDDYAPLSPKIVNNIIYGIGTGVGITVSGALTATNGTPAGYASNPVIHGNTLNECGIADDQYGGALIIKGTRNASIVGNSLRDNYVFGINIYHTNTGFTVQGNTIQDARSNTYTAPSAIVVRADYNYGIINGNSLIKVGTSFTEAYVSTRGIFINLTTNVDVEVGINYNTFTTPVRFSSHGFAVDSKKLYSSTIPTSGLFTKGDYVENINPSELGAVGSKYILNGWKRMTTGNSHVLNTDWFEDRGLTGN